eukprot:5048180-Pleurochrysis_carterae.AAC.3
MSRLPSSQLQTGQASPIGKQNPRRSLWRTCGKSRSSLVKVAFIPPGPTSGGVCWDKATAQIRKERGRSDSDKQSMVQDPPVNRSRNEDSDNRTFSHV